MGSSLCTIGLVAMFALLGSLPILFGKIVYQYLQWLTPLSGIIIISMGLIMSFGVYLPNLPIPVVHAHTKRLGISGFVLYGIAYGMAALGCSAPILLSVIMFTFSSGSFFQGLIAFIFYAFGMGSTLIVLSVIFVTLGEPILHRFGQRVEKLRKASGILLVVIGLYLIYYFAKLYIHGF